eukprot:COSAG01_NODE_38711_length_486_cov_0.795866_1_plen_88_part_10
MSLGSQWDAQKHVKAVYDILKQKGIPVWMDIRCMLCLACGGVGGVEEGRGIEGGRGCHACCVCLLGALTHAAWQRWYVLRHLRQHGRG